MNGDSFGKMAEWRNRYRYEDQDGWCGREIGAGPTLLLESRLCRPICLLCEQVCFYRWMGVTILLGCVFFCLADCIP